MHTKWKHFLKLFDSTFFRMAFQFILILFVAFLILLAVGYYEASGGDKPFPTTVPDYTR